MDETSGGRARVLGRLLATVVLVLPVSAGVPARAAEPAADEPQNGNVAYVRCVDISCFDRELFVVDGDGSSPVRIGSGEIQGPSWSPDGTRLAYTDDTGSGASVFVALSDGSARLRVTPKDMVSAHPAWSPDGSKIAFSMYRGSDTGSEIYVMNSDASNLIRLTDNDVHDAHPSWSPDGRIAFTRRTLEGVRIFVMDADGSNQTMITAGLNGDHGDPEWSPDGNRIVFVAFEVANGNRYDDIYLIDPDGSNLVALTNTASAKVAYAPTWAPDGTRLLFHGGGFGGSGGIMALNADGTHVSTFRSGRLLEPTWAAAYHGPTCRGLPVTLRGTAGNDRLIGTELPDVIYASGGNDTVIARGGSDLVCGGAGSDVIRGRSGADRLYGNAGADQIYGNKGKDKLYGNKGSDELRGGPGADRLIGGPGRDVLIGGLGTDSTTQ